MSSSRSSGGTTLACDNLAGWPTASKVHFVTYRIDSNSDPVAGTQLDCYGIVSGNNIGSFAVVDGTDTGNSVNDVVEMLPTAAWGQDLADALGQVHERTGLLKSGVTYPSPTFSGTATGSLTSLSLTAPTLASPTISGTITGAVVKNANLSTSAGELGAAWQAWTPSYGGNDSMTFGTVTTTKATYQQSGKTVFFRISATGTVGGTPSTDLTFTLPVTAATAVAGGGTLITDGGAAFAGIWYVNSTTVVNVRRFDAANWSAGASRSFVISGVYEAA